MSYQLHCPNCSEAILPANINVQKVIAACDNCGAVFNFEEKVSTAQRKIKRRKSKKPDYITQTETVDGIQLDMPFLLTTGYKIGMGVLGSVILGVFLLLLFAILPDNDPSDTVPLILFGTMFTSFSLAIFSSFLARQTIEANSSEVKHQIQLGNVPVYQRKVSSDDVVDVTMDEMTATRESIQEARYNLYVEKYDGRQDMMMQNQPEEMTGYVQQVLSSYFNPDNINDVSSRLEDNVQDSDDVYLVDEQQQNQQQGI